MSPVPRYDTTQKCCSDCGATRNPWSPVGDDGRGRCKSCGCRRGHKRSAIPPKVRLLRFVEVSPTGCWIWQGYLDSQGYGRFQMDGTSWPAHRASYTLHKGPIPDGLTLDHLCRVRACVDPDHLEPVTLRENQLRSPLLFGNKTHCVHGHPLSGKNLYRRGNRRHCRTCGRRGTKDYLARKRAKEAVSA